MAVFTRLILPVILILIADVILSSSTIQYNPEESQITFNTESVYQSYKGRYLLVVENNSDSSSTRVTGMTRLVHTRL